MNSTSPAGNVAPLLSLGWDTGNWSVTLSLSLVLTLVLVLIFAALFALKWWLGGFSFKTFEIDQAEIGVGNNKFRFRPNLSDKQVAYAIWVELSTRKIGLPIDFDDDVIA